MDVIYSRESNKRQVCDLNTNTGLNYWECK